MNEEGMFQAITKIWKFQESRDFLFSLIFSYSSSGYIRPWRRCDNADGADYICSAQIGSVSVVSIRPIPVILPPVYNPAFPNSPHGNQVGQVDNLMILGCLDCFQYNFFQNCEWLASIRPTIYA